MTVGLKIYPFLSHIRIVLDKQNVEISTQSLKLSKYLLAISTSGRKLGLPTPHTKQTLNSCTAMRVEKREFV